MRRAFSQSAAVMYSRPERDERRQVPGVDRVAGVVLLQRLVDVALALGDGAEGGSGCATDPCCAALA